MKGTKLQVERKYGKEIDNKTTIVGVNWENSMR